MTKHFILTLWAIAIFLVGLIAGHIGTIMNLEIETDGYGDSAIITTFAGQQYLYAINGHELDTWGTKVYDLGKP